MESIEFIDIKEACHVVGGEKSPIHPSTYYRGVKAGLYEPPVKVGPNISRVNKPNLLKRLAKLIDQQEAA